MVFNTGSLITLFFNTLGPLGTPLRAARGGMYRLIHPAQRGKPVECLRRIVAPGELQLTLDANGNRVEPGADLCQLQWLPSLAGC